MIELVEAVDKLRRSSARLNQLTDEANTTVKEVEDFLNKECSAGIFASVAISAPSLDEPDVAGSYLEYRRFGQRYRIAVVSKSLFDPESESVKSWSECPRDEKLRAIKKLPELIMEVAQNLDEKIVDAEKTMASVSQVLRTLPRKKKKIPRVPITPPPPRALSVPPTLQHKKED